MKLIPDFDTITIEYTFDKNYDKLSEVLKKNVFIGKPNWKYNLRGEGFSSIPKIRYDMFYHRGFPPAIMYLLNNSLHNDDNKLLVRIQVRAFHLIRLGIGLMFFMFIFAGIITIFVEIIISADFFAIFFMLFFLLLIFAVLMILVGHKTYAQNRDKLIQNFEKLLRDNDIVFHKTNELKENPTWLQKIKKAFRAVIEWW